MDNFDFCMSVCPLVLLGGNHQIGKCYCLLDHRWRWN